LRLGAAGVAALLASAAGASSSGPAAPAARFPGIGGAIRISGMGPGGDPNFGALDMAVAYNSQDDEYLVVWYGDDSVGGLVEDEYEIFGQRIDAATGAPLGADDFRISDLGPNGDPDFDATFPAVAYDSGANQYLVVWMGDDDAGGLVDGELEIFGQRLSAAGAPLGANDFRISSMGPDGSASFDAFAPAVAYDAVHEQFLVVWSGDDDTGALVDDEFEIWGQRLDSAGLPVGADDFRISDQGADGDPDWGTGRPALAFSPAENEFFVVWDGDTQVNDEIEIFGQRLDAATGAEVGANDVRLSDVGPNGSISYGAFYPAIAYSAAQNEYLVVWEASDDGGGMAPFEREIFGQRVLAQGGEVGINDFRISDMGGSGDASFEGGHPAVVAVASGGYFVVWYGDDDLGGLVEDEWEIFGQRLAANGAALGFNDFRISRMGPNGDPQYDGAFPALAYDSTRGRLLPVWTADHHLGGSAEDELETYGSIVTPSLFEDDFESGGTGAWSSTVP
jgi:hypothetical protein